MTEDRFDLEVTTPAAQGAFVQPTFGHAYMEIIPGPQQLGNAVFAVWLQELLLCLLVSRNEFIFNAPAAQQRSYNGQATNWDENFQYPQENQTQWTQPSNGRSSLDANSRSHRLEGSDGGSPPPEGQTVSRHFERYGPPVSIREINEGIRQLLLGISPATEGYIYGFTHPSDKVFQTTAGSNHGLHLIKIGRSIDYERRMRQFLQRCKYVPQVVFAHFMPHHFRIELVVHLQLHNARLRDMGCTGCGARHGEWFRVDVADAERIVRLWQVFASCQPYDDQGGLLPMWLERLQGIDMDDADCWEHFIRGYPSYNEVAAFPQELEDDPYTPW